MFPGMAALQEALLAAELRRLLRLGMHMSRDLVRTMEQVLAVGDAQELAQKLAACEDAEVWPMRELALFPDNGLALAVEEWLVERERGLGRLFVPGMEALSALLDGAEVRLILPDGGRFNLVLEKQEARLFLIRLFLHRTVPESVRRFLASHTGQAEHDAVLGVRIACRRARLPWTPAQESFVLDLLQGCFRAEPTEGLRARLVPLLRWSLAFLEHAGEDVRVGLARRREELWRRLDQAAAMDKMRGRYNYETRRMHGIVEPCLDPEALREELGFLETASRIVIGGDAFGPPILHRDLGEAANAEDLRGMLDSREW